MSHGWKHAAALPVLAALVACSPSAKQDANDALNSTENAFDNAANAAGNLADNAAIALTPTPSPQEFADTAAKSDAFEIAAGELAKANGSTAAIRDFGAMMVTAHTASTASIKKAAAAASPAIAPNVALTADQKEDLADLAKLKGVEFDRAYIDDQIDAHEDALALMRKYAADGEAPTLKAAAAEIAPTVEKHLAQARALDTD